MNVQGSLLAPSFLFSLCHMVELVCGYVFHENPQIPDLQNVCCLVFMVKCYDSEFPIALTIILDWEQGPLKMSSF